MRYAINSTLSCEKIVKRIEIFPSASPIASPLLVSRHSVDQVSERPKAGNDASSHRGRQPTPTAVAGESRSPAEVVIGDVEGDRGFKVFQLL